MNEAVGKRITEATAVAHYKTKIEAETQKLKDAEKAAEDVQSEFEVRATGAFVLAL